MGYPFSNQIRHWKFGFRGEALECSAAGPALSLGFVFLSTVARKGWREAKPYSEGRCLAVMRFVIRLPSARWN